MSPSWRNAIKLYRKSEQRNWPLSLDRETRLFEDVSLLRLLEQLKTAFIRILPQPSLELDKLILKCMRSVDGADSFEKAPGRGICKEVIEG